MFKSVTSFFKKLFSNETGNTKNAVPVTANAPKERKSNTSVPSKNSKVKPKNKVKKQSRQPDKKTSGVRREPPKMPESLKEVAPCEGKMRFLDLELDKRVQFGIQHAGFEYCTAIQELTLPPLLERRDLAGKAQTGTGKTAAFLLASFTRLLAEPAAVDRANATPRMVVLAPTRELAMQIHKDASELGIFTGLNIAVVFGGMDHEKQRTALDCQLDVLIGTPGRVIDYSRSGALNLTKVEILVIDEADRMLDMGFIPDVKRIVSQMPRKGERQTLLFSATLDKDILNLASSWLAEPVVFESEPEKMVSDNICQTFYSVLREEKLALLLYILKNTEYERMIIFGNRKDVNLRLQYDLARYGFNISLLSGDISQEKRIKILEKFRSGKEKVVIATDVAARGIHVDNVSIVVNYDLPEQPEDYIHRIGRTGRAGNTGTAISFLCEYGAYYLPPIEKLLNTQFSSSLPTEEMLIMPEEVANPQLPAKVPVSSAGKRSNKSSFRRNSFNRRHR
ncbi:MAG: DEAD/DEAH box helicase [Lentisphaerae bacterium]|nr:DEAD/DEAH box helicase [Lentisphaerota bacterium]